MNKKLKDARLAKNWTQGETANYAGISRMTYLRTEQETQCPHEDTIRRICNLFDCSPEKLGFSVHKKK